MQVIKYRNNSIASLKVMFFAKCVILGCKLLLPWHQSCGYLLYVSDFLHFYKVCVTIFLTIHTFIKISS